MDVETSLACHVSTAPADVTQQKNDLNDTKDDQEEALLDSYNVEEEELSSSPQLGPLIGSGDFADVHTVLENPNWAAKVYKRGKSESASQELMNHRYIKKAGGHSNLVGFHGTFACRDEQGNEKFGILMEYCGENTLLDLINRTEETKYINESLFQCTAQSLCGAAAFLHRVRFSHVDIKPSNCIYRIVDGAIYVKLADYGQSKVWEEGEDECQFRGSGMGARKFRSPELLELTDGLTNDEEFTCSKDILMGSDNWAIGCIVMRLCSRKVKAMMNSEKSTLWAAGIRRQFFLEPKFARFFYKSTTQPMLDLVRALLAPAAERSSAAHAHSVAKMLCDEPEDECSSSEESDSGSRDSEEGASGSDPIRRDVEDEESLDELEPFSQTVPPHSAPDVQEARSWDDTTAQVASAANRASPPAPDEAASLTAVDVEVRATAPATSSTNVSTWEAESPPPPPPPPPRPDQQEQQMSPRRVPMSTKGTVVVKEGMEVTAPRATATSPIDASPPVVHAAVENTSAGELQRQVPDEGESEIGRELGANPASTAAREEAPAADAAVTASTTTAPPASSGTIVGPLQLPQHSAPQPQPLPSPSPEVVAFNQISEETAALGSADADAAGNDAEVSATEEPQIVEKPPVGNLNPVEDPSFDQSSADDVDGDVDLPPKWKKTRAPRPRECKTATSSAVTSSSISGGSGSGQAGRGHSSKNPLPPAEHASEEEPPAIREIGPMIDAFITSFLGPKRASAEKEVFIKNLKKYRICLGNQTPIPQESRDEFCKKTQEGLNEHTHKRYFMNFRLYTKLYDLYVRVPSSRDCRD